MRVIIFDTETTGLPKSKLISPDTLHLWPHIVQFSYGIYDTELTCIVELFDYVVKVKNTVVIPEDSIKFHGITNQMSMEIGVPIEEIFGKFFYYLQTVDKVIGHNVSFDINMVKIELLRLIYSKDIQLSQNEIKMCKQNLHYITNLKNIYCTLQESIKLCNIPAIDSKGKPYLKYPRLIELHKKLFESEPNNLHNSLNDILVTLRCYIKMNFATDILDDKDEKYNDIYNRVFNSIPIHL
jgi:DNA polymerase III epsilon subunit-like protein